MVYGVAPKVIEGKMITLEKAKNIAQKYMYGYPIAEIIDIGECWVFCFNTGIHPVPGIPAVTVNKKDGVVGVVTVPPLENLDLLDSGEVIWKSQV